MMTSELLFDVLVSLYRVRGDGTANRSGAVLRLLCAQNQARPTDIARALIHLESRGLVDAQRLTLTMPGLAAAASLHSRRERLSTAA